MPLRDSRLKSPNQKLGLVDPIGVERFNSAIMSGVRRAGASLLMALLAACGGEGSSGAPAKAKDPICGMEVQTTGAPTLSHDGKDYFFCADVCKQKFEKQINPSYADTLVTSLNQAKMTECMSNLRQLLQKFLMSRMTDNLTDLHGKELLRKLAGTEYPLRCPLAKAGDCNFRGPKGDPNKLTSRSVFACDDPGNHPDGSIHVAYCDTRVEVVYQNNPAYKEALDQTSE